MDIDETLLFDEDELAMLSRDFVNDPDYSRAARHVLFVYGTMKQGHINHNRLHQDGRTKFLGHAKTETPEYDLGIWHKKDDTRVPVAQDGDHYLCGELYEITGPMLQMVDLCEGHPTTYKRIRILVGGDKAWMYFFTGWTITPRAPEITEYAVKQARGKWINKMEYRAWKNPIKCKICTN